MDLTQLELMKTDLKQTRYMDLDVIIYRFQELLEKIH
jgi:hypothetical protein